MEDSLSYRGACRYRFISMRKFTSHETNNDACVRSRCNEPQRCPPRPNPPRKSDLEFDRRQLKAKRTRYGSRHPVCAHAYVPHKHTRALAPKTEKRRDICRRIRTHVHAEERDRESSSSAISFEPSPASKVRHARKYACGAFRLTLRAYRGTAAWCDMHARAVKSRTPPGGRTRAHGFETKGHRTKD